MVFIQPQPTLEAQMDENASLIHPKAALTLRRANIFVFGTVNTATNNWTLTLPSVAEAIGQIVYIQASVANSKTLTVQDNADDGGLGDIALDGDGEYVCLISTGLIWRELLTGYS